MKYQRFYSQSSSLNFVEFRWHHFDSYFDRIWHRQSTLIPLFRTVAMIPPSALGLSWVLAPRCDVTWLLRSLEYCKLNLMRPDAPVWTCVNMCEAAELKLSSKRSFDLEDKRFHAQFVCHIQSGLEQTQEQSNDKCKPFLHQTRFDNLN